MTCQETKEDKMAETESDRAHGHEEVVSLLRAAARHPHKGPSDTDASMLRAGDALEVLRMLPDASVNCCVTSPPYFGLQVAAVAVAWVEKIDRDTAALAGPTRGQEDGEQECERCEGTGDIYGRATGPIAICPDCNGTGCAPTRPAVPEEHR